MVRAEGFSREADEVLFVGCGQMVKSFACQSSAGDLLLLSRYLRQLGSKGGLEQASDGIRSLFLV